MDVKLGEEVGYTIRFEDVTNPVRQLTSFILFCYLLLFIMRFMGPAQSGIWLFVGILCIKIRLCMQFCYCGCSCIVGAQIFILLALQAATMIKFLTDGVLLREIMNDPLLTKYRYQLWPMILECLLCFPCFQCTVFLFLLLCIFEIKQPMQFMAIDNCCQHNANFLIKELLKDPLICISRCTQWSIIKESYL